MKHTNTHISIMRSLNALLHGPSVGQNIACFNTMLNLGHFPPFSFKNDTTFRKLARLPSSSEEGNQLRPLAKSKLVFKSV